MGFDTGLEGINEKMCKGQSGQTTNRQILLLQWNLDISAPMTRIAEMFWDNHLWKTNTTYCHDRAAWSFIIEIMILDKI